MGGNHRFFKCEHCGNLTGLILNKGVPLVCCGEKMKELVPNTAEASTEKHLPSLTVSVSGIEVQVGSVPHPMEEEHHITFVFVETENGGQRKCLKPGSAPRCAFSFIEDKPVNVYAYCNLHGLWLSEV